MSQKFRADRKGSKYGLAIITGGSSGIGETIIQVIRRLGAESLVFNLSRNNPATFSNDPNLLHIECNLANPDHRKRAFAKLREHIADHPHSGPILLVNNAGQGSYGPIAESSPAALLSSLELNINAAVELTSCLLPELLQRGGDILNIASTTAFQPTPYMATYGAAKTFLLHWTLALNEELRDTPVRAVTVCPGPTRTRFFENAGADPSKLSAQALASPEEVAERAFRALRRGSPLVVCGLLNQILASIACRLPKPLAARLASHLIQRLR